MKRGKIWSAGRFAGAKSELQRIEELQGGVDPENAYDLARIEALAGDTAGALHWLELALQRGYNNYRGIMTDEELTPVLADGRFGGILRRYFPPQR